MPLAWRPDDDATRGNAAKPLLQHRNVLHDAGTQLLVALEALKVDLDRGLHAGSPEFLALPSGGARRVGGLARDGRQRRAALFRFRVRQTLAKAQEDAALRSTRHCGPWSWGAYE